MPITSDPLQLKKNVEPIRDRILARKETIAVAESVTSGLLQVAFSMAPDAEKFYQGGITAYNIGQKVRHLKTEPIHAMECNCVSLKVSAEMATHVCDLFNSDWGIGITGYVTPVPESENKVFAYFAICYRGRIVVAKSITPKKGNPFAIQVFYANEVLKELYTQMNLLQ